MWIDGLKNTVAYVTFDRHCKPRLKLEQSLVYPGMTAGVCWPALSRQQECVGQDYLAALLQPHFLSPIHLSKRGNNPEVYLSEQSVRECNSLLLLMIDSHHQH